jgi:hypothetical protein
MRQFCLYIYIYICQFLMWKFIHACSINQPKQPQGNVQHEQIKLNSIFFFFPKINYKKILRKG